MERPDDQELFLQLKQGNQDAFRDLFEKYYPALCHFAHQFTADDQLAEEIVQDLFVRIWEKRDSLQVEISVKQYLFRSVKNLCINYLKHEKIKKKYASDIQRNPEPDDNADHWFLEIDLMKKIEASIESMPPRRKEIFLLSREQGLKYKEIADSMGISVKTVEAQMGLALKHLREHLKDFDKHLISLFFILRKKRLAQ